MDIAQQSLALVLVFALLGTALWLVRKRGWLAMRGAKPARGRLESRGKLVLGPRHSIHLIRAGERILILALHPDGVTFLGEAGSVDDNDRKEAIAT
jgi:flagellar biogenesis protein FliO